MLPGDGPVDEPDDYPCRFQLTGNGSCQDCSDRGEPACPLTEEEDV